MFCLRPRREDLICRVYCPVALENARTRIEGTGMKEGDTVEGLIGWEYHGSPAKSLPGMEIVALSEAKGGSGKPLSPHVATVYDGPKGNVVFDAGSIWWAQGLSSPPGHVLPAHKAKPQGPDRRVQRMMKNVFDRFVS